MAHSANIIKKINISGTVYDLHDEQAIHTLADLANLGMEVEGAFVFKGTVATKSDLPVEGNKIGYVYHVADTHSEFIWCKVDDAEEPTWEEFGEHFVVSHTHKINTSGSVSITGTNSASNVTVTGSNAASGISGTCSVSVPKVTKSANYIKLNKGSSSFVKSYPGVTSKMVTTSIKQAGNDVTVVTGVTPTTSSVTGVSGSTTASKATAGTAVAVAKAGTAVSIPNVTGNTDVTATLISSYGSLPSWKASVSDGVLSFSWGAGSLPTGSNKTASKTTLGTALSVTPAVGNGTITPYTFTNVTVPQAASTATTVVTGVAASTGKAATAGTSVTVATGGLSSTGVGATVMTGLGTPSTGSGLTDASLGEGTSTDGILVGDTVGISSNTVNGTISGTAAAQTWAQKSGTAAAQTWAQKSGTCTINATTGTPQ